jgi:hypothetical protein
LMVFRRDDFDVTQFIKDEETNNKINNQAMFQAVALTTLISQGKASGRVSLRDILFVYHDSICICSHHILAVRQMEACLRMTKVSFMPKLLGCKKSTHIRFNDDEDEEEEVIHEEDFLSGEDVIVDDEEFSDAFDNEKDDNNSIQSLLEKLPKLNPTQEKAATSFLASSPASLILVQG